MIKKKSYVKSISTLVAGLTLLTACSSTKPTVGPAKTEKTEIVVVARAGAMADALTAVAENYETKTGNTVKINALPYDSLKEKVVLDVRNKSGAFDLTMIDDPWMPEFGQSGLLAPLDSYFKDGVDKDFVQKCVDLGKEPYATGKLYALPLIGNVEMLFYRNDLFEKYNLSAPKTWDDVVKAAETIVKGEQEVSGYVIRGQRGNPIVADYLPVFWGYGGEVLDKSGKPQVNSEAGIKAMETYLKLKNLGPKGVETFDSDQIATTLTQGRTAMAVAWPSWVSTVDNPTSSKVVNKITFSKVPGQVSDMSAVIGNWMLGVLSTSKHKDAAVDFLKWITGKEAQKSMALVGGGVPTRTSLFKDEELIKKYRQYPAQLDALEHSVARPRTPYWSKIEDTWGLYLSQIVSGGIGVKEGLDKANQEIEKILK